VGGRAERLKQLDQAYDHVYWFLGLGGRALGVKMTLDAQCIGPAVEIGYQFLVGHLR
jgi:hypothetical protein